MLYYSLNNTINETMLNARIEMFIASGQQRMEFADGWVLYYGCDHEVRGFINRGIFGNESLQIGRRSR